MRTSLVLFILELAVLSGVSNLWGNPAMLPKHPGYPMGYAVDAVNGEPTANDAGQSNAVGECALQESQVSTTRTRSSRLRTSMTSA